MNSLDRVELGIKLDQMNKLRDRGEFEEAAKVADTIEWRKIKRWSDLSFAADIYESAERLKDARNVCVYAYNRNLGGKRLIYRLAELSIKIDDLDEAEELYKEFVEEAPKDTSRFILLYKINIAREAPVDRLIEILEEYKQNELEEQYEYELALLYAKADRIEECIRECDDLILWFNEGEYVEKALVLKSNFVPLTQTQQKKFEEMQREKARAAVSVAEEKAEDVIPEYEYETKSDTIASKTEDVNADDIKIPVNNYSIYDTQNLQAEIAKSMSIILEGMAKGKKTPEDEAVLRATGFESSDEPVIESLEAATPEQEQCAPEESVNGTTKEIRVNAHFRNKSTPVSDVNSNTDTDEENAEDVVEGQIGIMDWLNANAGNNSDHPLAETSNIMDAVSEIVAAFENTTAVTEEPQPEYEQEPELQQNTETETENEVVTESEPDISEEDRMVDELTRKLIEEVQADLKERTATIVPDEHPEEEYVSSQDETSGEELAEELTEEFREEESSFENPVQLSKEITKTVPEETPEESEEVTEELPKEEPENVYEESHTGYKLTDDEKKYVRKYLSIAGMEETITNIICGKKNEISDGTSSYGNIVITGKADADKSGVAINLFKALHAGEDIKKFKIAKTTSSSLNKKGITNSIEKIKGTTLIIENAGTLTPDVVKELTAFMLGQTGSMLLIITGEDYSINKLFRDFPTFAAMFSYTIELKNMSANDLVNMAKEYANEQGYVIEEKALLQIYLIIDGLQMTYPGSEVEEVKKLVDEAIERCDNGTKWPFGRKSKGLIILKEKHFK